MADPEKAKGGLVAATAVKVNSISSVDSSIKPTPQKPADQSLWSQVKQLAGKINISHIWYKYFAGIAVILLAALPPIITVMYPKLAQANVNNSQFIPTMISVRNPTMESIMVAMVGMFRTDVKGSPTTGPWQASMWLEDGDEPWTLFDMQPATIKNKTIFASAETSVQLNQTDEVARMLSRSIYTSGSFLTYLRGNSSYQQSPLPATKVKYNKRIQLTAMKAIPSVRISSYSRKIGLPYGANSHGKLTYTNPTVFNIELGNVTADVLINGTTKIMNATIPDMYLESGKRIYTIYATIDEEALESVVRQGVYQCGVLPVSLNGTGTTHAGQRLPYMDDMMKMLNTFSNINITSALRSLKMTDYLNGTVVNGTCQGTDFIDPPDDDTVDADDVDNLLVKVTDKMVVRVS